MTYSCGETVGTWGKQRCCARAKFVYIGTYGRNYVCGTHANALKRRGAVVMPLPIQQVPTDEHHG